MKKKNIIIFLIVVLTVLVIFKYNNSMFLKPDFLEEGQRVFYLNQINNFTFMPPDDSKTPIIDTFSRTNLDVIINPPSKENTADERIPSNFNNNIIDKNNFEIVDRYYSPKYLKYLNDSRGYSIYFEPEVENME